MSQRQDKRLDWHGSGPGAVSQSGLKVPYLEFGPHYGLEEARAALEAMQSEILTLGPYLELFQQEFAEYLGCEYAFGVSSCTGALEIATQLLELGEGDEVIVPAITFIATAIPLLRVGAKVVFADLDPQTYLVTADTIAAKITDKTRAIYVVHMYGMPADMDPIMALARKHELKVVEDCAHCAGAEYKGRKAGAIGDIGCFSFHTVKNVTTLGEGGLLATNNREYAGLAPRSRWVGLDPYADQQDYWLPFLYDIKRVKNRIPYNFCMGEVQANIGRVQLKKLDWMNRRRNAIAMRMNEGLQGLDGIMTPQVPADRTHAFHLYPLLFDGSAFGADINDLIRMLYYEFGIKTVPHYLPPYRFDIFQEMGYPKEMCPQAERIYSQLTNTPMNLSLTDAQVEYMIESIGKTVDRLKKGRRRPAMNYPEATA